jgi:hypothetical protein
MLWGRGRRRGGFGGLFGRPFLCCLEEVGGVRRRGRRRSGNESLVRGLGRGHGPLMSNERVGFLIGEGKRRSRG